MKAYCPLVMCMCLCVFLVLVQIFDHAFTCRIIIQMVLVVVFPHRMSPCFMWPDTDMQPCLSLSVHYTLWVHVVQHMPILLSGWRWWSVCVYMCVCAQQICISCQHFGRSNMPNFKLMPCQWMWRGTAYADRGRSFQPSMLIVSLMYKIRVSLVKKTLIYTL